MDDSPPLTNNKSDSRLPIDVQTFGVEERQQFGQHIRLAMACMEGAAVPVNTKAMPSEEVAIRNRLKVLSQDITSGHADLLELLVRYDDMEGWASSGCKHCAAWMNLEMGISLQLAWEYLRVGRKLRLLPTTTALFRAGKLSWSKIRLIASIADKDTEKTLCHAALDAAVTDVKRLCDGYRWKDNELDGAEGREENDRALKQWNSRSLRWDELGSGSTRIQLILPPEIARAFLASVEHSLNQLDQTDDSDANYSQRRADAAVRMAETSLQAAGRDTATADRYQVIVSVDADELAVSGNVESRNMESRNNVPGIVASGNEASGNEASGSAPGDDEIGIPSRRATVNGAGHIARDTARRIACDCSITTHMISNGEPIDIGRKSRLWPNAMARAIKDRDQHCQFYGCTQTQNLQIHHMTHWADGGSTSIANGVCLCQGCHTKVHEGGYSIQPVDGNEQRLEEQFEQQQRADDLSLFNFEKELRNNRDSFNQVRTLLPTRYRFRVVDVDGKDIRNLSSVNACRGETHNSSIPAHSTVHSTSIHSTIHSTRVEYDIPESGSHGDDQDDAFGNIAEQSAVYRFDTGRYQVMAL